MKRYFIFVLVSLLSILATKAQDGPAGIGTASNLELWLDATSLGAANGDSISTWTDMSGNANHASLVGGYLKPSVETNILNGQDAVKFTGAENLELASNITTLETSVFFVHKKNITGNQVPFALSNHAPQENINKSRWIYLNPTQTNIFVSLDIGQYSLMTLQSDAGTSGVNATVTNGFRGSVSTIAATRNEGQGLLSSNIGCRNTGSPNYRDFFHGTIAELIVYNERLNTAKRNIVAANLAAKYNLLSTVPIYAHKTSYNIDVTGIGQESDGSHTTARSENDSLEISNASTLDDGDYVLIGSNGGDFSTTTSVPLDATERLNRTWRVDLTGTPGTVDLRFYISGIGFAAISDYAVLGETIDGDFSNGGTSILATNPSFDAGTNSILFSGVSLTDGMYLALAEQTGDITAINSGSWENPANWSCGCIPDTFDLVSIPSPHTISVDSNASVFDITVESGAGLTFDGFDTLKVHRNLTFKTGLSLNDGTIAALGNNRNQSFSNTSASEIELNNLYVNNTLGLSLSSGGWSLAGNLQVSSGGLDVSSADSIVLLSTVSKSSQVLESMSNAFIGDFIVQRHISNRNPGYANLSSPITNATVADLDNDSILLSGVGGKDGNILLGGGGIFRSMFLFDFVSDTHAEITSTSTSLTVARGFELYLLTTTTYFGGTTVDFRGPLNNGTIDVTVDRGWNLIGNPYHSHINYDDIRNQAWVPDEYYIFNSTSGTYDFFDGPGKPAIAPSQGFWFNKLLNGTSNNGLKFRESAKVSSNSGTFLRKKEKSEYLTLHLTNNKNSYHHKSNIGFDAFATSDFDNMDALHLSSPIEEAPAIYSKPLNSDVELVLNKLNPLESHHMVPVSIYSGVNGIYNLKAENIDKVYENYSCIFLKDNQNGESIDLAVEESYSFEASKGKSDRFSLFLSNSYTECQKMLASNTIGQRLETNMSLRNVYGQWYLDYTLGENSTQVEIRIYNMNGQEVSSPLIFSASNAGSYPIQSINELKGIFLIQIKSAHSFINKTIKL